MKKIWLWLPIRFKILSYYFIMVGLLFLVLIIFNNNNKDIMLQLNETIDSNYNIYIAMERTGKEVKDFEKYLLYNDSGALKSYQDGKADIDDIISSLYAEQKSLESYFRVNAIYYSVNASRGKFDQAIMKKIEGDDTCYGDYYDAMDINKYTHQYFNELLMENSRYESQRAEEVKDEANRVRKTLYNFIFIIGILALSLGILISNYIVMPIKKLSNYSKAISKGNLNIKEVDIDSTDEIGDLAQAYNHMGQSIRNYVERIKGRVNIEKKLHQEERAVMQMEQLLQVARLEALQAKINPHFLFNTLNVIARTAFFEDASQTMDLIQMLSKIFRYQLKSANEKVTLVEEKVLISDYLKLQSVRFKERLEYNIEIPSDIDIFVPVLTLQPLVENAIIHGIGPRIIGGKIEIKVYLDGEKIVIEVSDDGVGMESKLVDQIISDKGKINNNKTSIGIRNVRDRFLLSFPDRSEFIIESQKDVGTTIQMIITREAKGNV